MTELHGSTAQEHANIDIVRRFLAAMEDGSDSETMRSFLADDAVAIEYPNRITTTTARRDVADMVLAGERGRALCRTQHYELHTIMAVGHVVAVELTWTATIGITVGRLVEGTELTAHFAAFYEVRDGRIAVIRNYDCFDPF